MSGSDTDHKEKVVGVFEWLITIPFMLIPFLNILIAAILSYYDQSSKSKCNFYYAVIFYSVITLPYLIAIAGL